MEKSSRHILFKTHGMAELIINENLRCTKSGYGKKKRHSLRIDMTPMADLGFLLITFFIFTASMSEPKSMNLVMPKDNGSPIPVKVSGALTLLIGDNDKVYYYEGNFQAGQQKKSSIKDIRQVIVNKKKSVAADDFFVIIKPSEYSGYKTVVDILDEMVISDVKRYAMVKISVKEEQVLSSR